MPARIEERLQHELEASIGCDAVLEVVLRFDMPKANPLSRSLPLAERRRLLAMAMSEKIEQALEHAGEAAGEKPVNVSVFPAVGSVYVQAHPPFLKVLLNQPEVLGATLNKASGSADEE